MPKIIEGSDKNVYIPGQFKVKSRNVAVGTERFGDYCGRNADFHIGPHTDGNYDTACSYGRICGVIDKA